MEVGDTVFIRCRGITPFEIVFVGKDVVLLKDISGKEVAIRKELLIEKET